MKRMNSLRLYPVVIFTWPYRKNHYLQVLTQVLRNTAALNSYIGLFMLCKKLLVYI